MSMHCCRFRENLPAEGKANQKEQWFFMNNTKELQTEA